VRPVLAAAVLALALAAPALASESHPTLAELESRVMCPVCKTTLDQSDSAAAQRIEAVIRQKIAAGETRSQIEQDLVEQFGPAILAAPPHRGFDLLAWWLPIAALVGGGLALAAAVWHRSRVRERDPEPSNSLSLEGSGGGTDEAAGVDPELERRLDEELARFDA
jgi:cytochrome c-type biogenesis protein CcmH